MCVIKIIIFLCSFWTTHIVLGTKQEVFPQSAYRTWEDAESSCKKDGLGLLVNIDKLTSSSVTELEDSITDTDPYWTGGYRLSVFYWKYGCFKTDFVASYLKNINQNETANSVVHCAVFCGQGKQWIGLMKGFCYCLDKVSPTNSEISQCTIPCPGHKRDTCGDEQATSIYKLLDETEIAEDIANEQLKDNQLCTYLEINAGTIAWKVDDCAQQKIVLCQNWTNSGLEFVRPRSTAKDWDMANQYCQDNKMEMAVVTLNDTNKAPFNRLSPSVKIDVWIALYRHVLDRWTDKDMMDNPTNCLAVEKNNFGILDRTWQPCYTQNKYVCLSEGASPTIESAVIGTPSPTTMSTEKTTEQTMPTKEKTTIPTTEQTAQQTIIPTTEQIPTVEVTTPQIIATIEQTTEQIAIQTTKQAVIPTTEVTTTQSIPATEQTTIPTTQQTTIPTTDQTAISTTEQITIQTTEQTTIPTREQTKIPTTEQITIQTTEQTTIPTTVQTTIPTTEQTTIPTTEQITIRTTEQTTIPTTEQITIQTTEQTPIQTSEQATSQTFPPTELTTQQTTITTTKETTIPMTDVITPQLIPTTELSTQQTTIQTTQESTNPITELKTTVTDKKQTYPTTANLTKLMSTEQTTKQPTSVPTTTQIIFLTTVQQMSIPTSAMDTPTSTTQQTTLFSLAQITNVKTEQTSVITMKTMPTKLPRGTTELTKASMSAITPSAEIFHPTALMSSTATARETTRTKATQSKTPEEEATTEKIKSLTVSHKHTTSPGNVSDVIHPNSERSSEQASKVPTTELIVVIAIFVAVLLLAVFVFLQWFIRKRRKSVTLNRRTSREITFQGEGEMLIRSYSGKSANMSPKPLPRIDIDTGSLEALSNIPDAQRNVNQSKETLDIPWIDASRSTLDNINASPNLEPRSENIGAKSQSAPELDRIGDESEEEDDVSNTTFLKTFSQKHPPIESEI